MGQAVHETERCSRTLLVYLPGSPEWLPQPALSPGVICGSKLQQIVNKCEENDAEKK